MNSFAIFFALIAVAAATEKKLPPTWRPCQNAKDSYIKGETSTFEFDVANELELEDLEAAKTALKIVISDINSDKHLNRFDEGVDEHDIRIDDRDTFTTTTTYDGTERVAQKVSVSSFDEEAGCATLTIESTFIDSGAVVYRDEAIRVSKKGNKLLLNYGVFNCDDSELPGFCDGSLESHTVINNIKNACVLNNLEKPAPLLQMICEAEVQ